MNLIDDFGEEQSKNADASFRKLAVNDSTPITARYLFGLWWRSFMEANPDCCKIDETSLRFLFDMTMSSWISAVTLVRQVLMRRMTVGDVGTGLREINKLADEAIAVMRQGGFNYEEFNS